MSVEPTRHRFSFAEYERMGEVGLFPPGQRLELLDGEIVEMTPIGPPHNGTVLLLTRRLTAGVGDRAIVGVQSEMRLSDLSAPQPDLMLLRPRADFYRTSHAGPADALLFIEVSDSTARFDREVKRPLYAAAGIPEVWIVDLRAGLVEVATDPRSGRYRVVRQLAPGEVAAPSLFPDLTLPVADLFV